MLEKLLRAPLPEQIVALLEKLEQNLDASHLEKVENLLESHATKLTGYERWVIKRQMRKNYHALRRERTLNNVMSIVVDRPTDEEERRLAHIEIEQNLAPQRAKMYASLSASTGTLTGNGQIINAHQQMMNRYASGYSDPRGVL